MNEILVLVLSVVLVNTLSTHSSNPIVLFEPSLKLITFISFALLIKYALSDNSQALHIKKQNPSVL